MKCDHCGTEIKTNSITCSYCGGRPKNDFKRGYTYTACVLCIGVLAFHYLDKPRVIESKVSSVERASNVERIPSSIQPVVEHLNQPKLLLSQPVAEHMNQPEVKVPEAMPAIDTKIAVSDPNFSGTYVSINKYKMRMIATDVLCDDNALMEKGYKYKITQSIPIRRLKNAADAYYIDGDWAITVAGCWTLPNVAHMIRKHDGRVFEIDNINLATMTRQ